MEQRTSSLNIQLDNLCQFLPQDRVQDFVGMDSFTLLQNTQKALGNDTLYQRHEALINLAATLQEVDRNLKAHSNSLKSVQQYAKRLEKDVESYKDREALKAKITDLTSKKAWLDYLKSREVFLHLKTQLEEVKHTKQLEEAKLTPLKKALDAMETKLAKYRVELNRCRTMFTTVFNDIKRKVEEDFDRVETNVNEEQARFKEQERSEMDRLKRVGIVTGKINESEKELEEIRLKGDMDDARRKTELKDLESQIRRLDESILEINGDDERFVIHEFFPLHLLTHYLRNSINPIRNVNPTLI